MLYSSYAVLTSVDLPSTDNSARVIVVIISFLVCFRMLTTAGLGLANLRGIDVAGASGCTSVSGTAWLLASLDAKAAVSVFLMLPGFLVTVV